MNRNLLEKFLIKPEILSHLVFRYNLSHMLILQTNTALLNHCWTYLIHLLFF